MFLILFIAFLTNVKGQLPLGSIAPDFTLQEIPENCDPNGTWGTVWNLYSELNAGKHVIIDFSTTWCSHCWDYHNTGILESLWEEHGSAGDNTIRVFFIEAYCNNTVQCLCGTTGCNSSTYGDWTAGVNYPIFNPSGTECTSINTAYQVASYPTFYAINAEHQTAWEVEHFVNHRLSKEEWESWLYESFALQLNIDKIQTDCNTTLDLSTSGGKGQLTYSWSNGWNTEDISGLLNGNYSVTVTDENGYFVEKNVLVNGNYTNCCIQDMNVDLSSNNDHSVNEMLTAMGLNSLEELCNSNNQYNILLNGNLILDSGNSSPVCFKGVNIAMMSGARITVRNETELNLKNVHIYGCNTMWDKIFIESGSKIIVNNESKIADAEDAIFAEKGAIIESYNSIYYNNNVGINLTHSGNGPNTNIKIKSCKFIADRSFSNLGNNNNPPILNPSTPLAGIYTTGQVGVNFITESGSENTFSNLSNGIICNHGSIIVRNAIFEEIHPYVIYAEPGGEADNVNSTNFLLWQDGFAVKIQNCTNKSVVEQCTFSDISIAVGCINGKLEVIWNKKSGDAGIAVVGYNLDNVQINFNNEFIVLNKGIFLNNCHGGRIDGHHSYKQKFTFTDSKYSNSTGIELQNCTGISINWNTIKNSNKAGIILQNSNENTLYKNLIQPYADVHSNGIVLENSNNNTLEENNLGSGSDIKSNSGIEVSDSHAGTYSCNTINSFINGTHFMGGCDRSLIEGTNYYSNDKDLVVGLSNALNTTDGMTVIGTQGNIGTLEGWGNKWYSHNSTAHHSGTPEIIQQSTFLVDKSEGSVYKPIFIEAAAPDIWFDDRPEIKNFQPCTGKSISDQNCSSIIKKILMIDTMRAINSCARVMWQYRYLKQLIEMKKKGLWSDECEGFLTKQKYSTILQVVKISKAIDSVNYVKIRIDSTQSGDSYRERLITAIDSIRLLIDNKRLVDSCLKVLNIVHNVRLNQIESDTLSNRDIAILQPIAESCTNEMGEGVYWARGLLSMYTDKRYPGFEECESPYIMPRSELISITRKEKLNIFPNPATEIVNIALYLSVEENGKIMILDIQGNEKYSKKVDKYDEKITVDTKSYPSGLYIVKYVSADGEEQIEKLMITK